MTYLRFSKLPLTFKVSRGALGLTREPRRYVFPILSEKIVTFLWNWKDVQWASNDLRMRARRAARPLSRNPPQRRWLSRRGIPWNPAAVRSGIRAKHESESELPPGANDYETTALSTSPIVRNILSLKFHSIMSLSIISHPRSALSFWDAPKDRMHSIRRNQRYLLITQSKI